MSELRKAGWSTVVVLLAFLAGTAYVAWRTHQDYLEAGERRRSATADTDAGPTPDTYVHHAWVVDAGSPAPTRPGPLPSTPVGIPQAAHDEAYDPQRWAMRREFQIVGDAGSALPFEPFERAARVVSRAGATPFGDDASCRARVLPARSGRFNCLVRVLCDGHVVYPNPTQTAGYVECTLDDEGRPVRAEDVGHTAVDGDPRVRFDRASDTLVVSDAGDGVEAFEVELDLSPR